MFTKPIATLAAVSLLSLTPAAPAAAGDVGAAILGGIIGGVIVNEANKNKNRTYRTTSKPRVSTNSPQRAENRETQTSLNYFGFPAGTPDGVMGSKSRTAISQYQAYMGFPITGQLSPYERNMLVTSYNRAQIGGPQVMQAASGPYGMKSLLVLWRDEAMGVNNGQNGQMAGYNGQMQNGQMQNGQMQNGQVMAMAPAPQMQMQVQPQVQPQVQAMQVQPQVQQPAATAPVMAGLTALPMATAAAPQASLASHCSKVSLLTNSNGGFVTLASMSDANMALSEQFCLARTYAIGTGEEMVSKVQGMSQAQVDQQCDGFGAALEPYVSGLDATDSVDLRTQVQAFVLQSNMTLEQLESTAKICMFTGYRRDKMDVALGSALVLVAIGKTPYAEMVGHHLSQGFGVTQSDMRAKEWYGLAVSALEQGADAPFAPGQPERVALIKAASSSLGVQGAATMEMTPQPAGLPTFSLKQ